MAFTTELTRGMCINFEGEPHILMEKEFYSPGKGGAFTRAKLKNIRTGKIFMHVYKSNEKVDELDLETKTMKYLYMDGSSVVFMDPVTFEQITVPIDEVDGGLNYLHADAKYIMTFYEDAVILLKLPQKISLKVVDAPLGSKGNTATSASKEIVLETGAKIMAPLFVKVGDTVVVNTETNAYDSKQN